jgi:hypothetical protein
VRIDWFTVARDVLMILVLLFVVMAATVTVVEGISPAVFITIVFLCLAAGFCVVGCLKPEGRFAHLALVAVGVWVLGALLNAATRGFPLEVWWKLGAAAVLPLAGAMLLGGAVSMAIVPTPESTDRPDDSPSS